MGVDKDSEYQQHMFLSRNKKIIFLLSILTKVSEYDQEIPQLQTADKPMES